MQRMTSMERAFHLARSGRFTTLTEVVTTLDREGYSANQIQGPLLKRQLTGLIKAARPEPLDRDLSRGVMCDGRRMLPCPMSENSLDRFRS